MQLAREAGAASGLGGHIPATVKAADCLTLVQQFAHAAPQQDIAYLPRGVADPCAEALNGAVAIANAVNAPNRFAVNRRTRRRR